MEDCPAGAHPRPDYPWICPGPPTAEQPLGDECGRCGRDTAACLCGLGTPTEEPVSGVASAVLGAKWLRLYRTDPAAAADALARMLPPGTQPAASVDHVKRRGTLPISGEDLATIQLAAPLLDTPDTPADS